MGMFAPHKEWIQLYFSFLDRIDKIFRIFFPGFPDESLEIPIAFGDN
jgi:hypothetical protein